MRRARSARLTTLRPMPLRRADLAIALGGEVHGPPPEASLADLAHFSGDPSQEAKGGRRRRPEGRLTDEPPHHVTELASVDFFVVPTVRFAVLFVFVVLSHDRRRVLHFNVTANPSARWTAQQVVEAFPWDEAPRYLLRDRDGICGAEFRGRVHNMGIEEVLIAPRSPWQSPYVERLIGSTRRECLDHVIVLNQDHLRRILSEYFAYYHEARAHLSLERNSPIPRLVCPPEQGKVVAKAYLGGLHHCYSRAA